MCSMMGVGIRFTLFHFTVNFTVYVKTKAYSHFTVKSRTLFMKYRKLVNRYVLISCAQYAAAKSRLLRTSGLVSEILYRAVQITVLVPEG